MAGHTQARTVAVFALFLTCALSAASPLRAQSDRTRLEEIAERQLRLSTRGNSVANSFQFEFTRTVRDDRGAAWTRRLLVECKEQECGLVFLSEQRVPWAFLRDRIFVLLDPAKPSQFRFLTEGRFAFASGVDTAGVPGFDLTLNASRDQGTGVTVDLGIVVRQLLAIASDISQRADRTYHLKCKNGLRATIVLSPGEQQATFPIERLTIEENERHSISVDRIYLNEPTPISVLSLNDEVGSIPKLRGTYRELPADSQFEEVDRLWETMRDGNPELDAAGKLLMRRFKRSAEQLQSDKSAAAPNRADAASVQLAELLNQPWRLTSRADSLSSNFQFECVHVVSNDGGKPWIRRMLVQRKGKQCGVLLLSEAYIPWGLLLDGQFLLADPDQPGQFGVVKGAKFHFVGGLGAEGTLGFGIGSSTKPDVASEIDLNLPGMVRRLLSAGFKASDSDGENITLRSPENATCTLVTSDSKTYPVKKVMLETGGARFEFGQFYIDEAPPLDFLTPTPDFRSLPKLLGWSVTAPPNSQFDLDGRVWARIRDGDQEYDAAGEMLLKRFRRTSNWPPATTQEKP